MSPGKFYHDVKKTPRIPLSSLCPQQKTQTWEDLCNSAGLTLLGRNIGGRKCHWKTLTVNLAFHSLTCVVCVSECMYMYIHVFMCVNGFPKQLRGISFCFLAVLPHSHLLLLTHLSSLLATQRKSINSLFMISFPSMI